MKIQRQGGFTLMEVCLSVVIVSMIVVGISHLLRLPGPALARMTGQADLQRKLAGVGRTLNDDLRGVDPGSISWTLLPSASGLTFKVARFDFATATTAVYPQIEYQFRPGVNPSVGSLVRITNAQETVLLEKIDAPVSATPLFDKDPVMPQILIVNISCRSMGMNEPWVQRIAIKS